ncbi:MAG: hypothetical protein ACYCQM_04585 [Acidithiobacillus sp.]
MEQNAETKKYPHLQAAIKVEDGSYINMRTWADKSGQLKGTVERNDPATGERNKADVEFKAYGEGDKAALVGYIKEGEKTTKVNLQKVAPEGKEPFVAMSVAEKGPGDEKYTYLKGRGGIVRENEDLAAMPNAKTSQLVSETLNVSRDALKPREPAQERATAEPEKSQPEKSKPSRAPKKAAQTKGMER